MKGNHKLGVPLILLIVLTIMAGVVWQYLAGSKPNIRIGVLHSLSGVLAASEKPLVDAIQLAVEEANAAGGIKGHKIEAVVADCRSDAAHCAREAERLILEERVEALFGCWTSTCRNAVKPVVERHDHLLFYALRYEGMEQSPNIIYGGAVPNQLVMPAVHWALENLGNRKHARHSGKRVYLAGSDNIFSRVLNILIKDVLAANGGFVSGEYYLPLGSQDMDPLVEDIVDQQPDLILSTIAGAYNAGFFQTLNRRGITAESIPVLSFSVTELVLSVQDKIPMAGHFAARNYFQTIPSPENQAFVQRFRDRYGEKAVIDSPAEASYVNVRMWIQAASEAGSGNLAKVQRLILRQSLPAPEGIVSLDPITRHVWKVARVGKVREDGQFDIVWDSTRPLEPSPFPSYRSREEWNVLLEEVLNKSLMMQTTQFMEKPPGQLQRAEGLKR
ncbi:urea transport system substrate-binding protein [Nitrosospira multiformis]|uniref:Urea transport system substrate-binding protein n=1 Tax=Nitrosospira multiformis TaxID=1231 RepID=A0A2T5IC98_9PROT|nr:ABC transporter substrate-binding protein [Nitrosospira multiformis]PTQ81457.1 urea transport system substrate-binding protein [Nitrosospira multiformis]